MKRNETMIQGKTMDQLIAELTPSDLRRGGEWVRRAGKLVWRPTRLREACKGAR